MQAMRLSSARVGLGAGAGTAVGFLFFPALAAAGQAAAKPAAPAGDAASAGRWALAIALAFLVVGIPLIATLLRWLVSAFSKEKQPTGLWWGRELVVGRDNRVSTSKTTALIWTYSVAAALLSFLIAEWLGHPHALTVLGTQGLDAQYAVLMGGPLGAAILAKGIVSSQVAKGSAAKPSSTTAPTPAQLVQNDAGEADLGDLQYLLFNVVALIFFYGELFRVPQRGMPTIPDVLVGLTSLSAVGFVGKKALAGPAGISNVSPEAAQAGKEVRIATAGLVQAADDLPGVTVMFGKVAASALRLDTTTSFGGLITARVPFEAAGIVDLRVLVPNSPPSTFSGFRIVPVIAEGQHLSARHGDPIKVLASGVGTPGKELPALTATVGGVRAETAVEPSGELRVTIPPNAPFGETELVLTTPGGADSAPITVLAPAATNGAQAERSAGDGAASIHSLS